jgi:heterodisulfide reductase subunit A
MEKLGIRTERLGLEWISAAEGLRFQQVMADMERIRTTVTPEEIERTQELMKKQGSRKKGSAPAEVQGPEAEGPAT